MLKISAGVGWCRAGLALVCALVSLAGSPSLAAQETPHGSLKAGAARLDIVDLAMAQPEQFSGINDPVYVRALVIEHEGRRAAFVSLDLGGVDTGTWDAVSRQLQDAAGIAPEALMLTATHTHSMPRLSGEALKVRIVQAVVAAAGLLEPARMAWGMGEAHINTNRSLIDPATGRWSEGPNRSAPSDKTVAVIAFHRTDGSPLAAIYNYAVHPVITGQLDQVSGDIPGAASRHVESYLGGGAVALFSYGAAGDQNPLYFQQTYDLREIRSAAYARRGEDIAHIMPPGGVGLDRTHPRVALLMDQQRALSDAMGLMLGEEVLHVLRANLEAGVTEAPITAASRVVMCPGRRRLDEGRAGSPGSYEPAEDLPIRLSLLRLGDVIVGGVDAELFGAIGTRFRASVPNTHTILGSLTNGFAPTGYIPADSAFGQHTFEVLSSRLQPGCAETAIVDGLISLVRETGPETRSERVPADRP